MNEGNGSTYPGEVPFHGDGPQNLSPKQLEQAWGLTAVLAYQRRVRVLTEQLRKLEREIER
jgi:hypothetical protein